MSKNAILALAVLCITFTANSANVNGKSEKKGSGKTKESIPRCEYPRPQFVRPQWKNLNGRWSYTFDFGKSGKDRGFQNSKGFDGQILVPFCPESSLSGVNYKDFIEAMWYQRRIEVPREWSGKKIILHFGSVDYHSEAFIDGISVGKHWGGTSSFSYDITRYVKPGRSHNLVVYVFDDTRSGVQPGGKQSIQYHSFECIYTRTTGIWQTVWLEAVDEYGLEKCQVIADLDGSRFIINPWFYSVKRGYKFRATLKDGTKTAGSATVAAINKNPCIITVSKPKEWSLGDPFLYDLVFEVLDEKGKVIDEVKSYAGMRKIHIEGNRIFLNNKPIFLRFVLDQGFYPDGIWTAPSDAALKRDIELSMKAGFNGARLHQKVFEERFHYWADKLGYLTWAESSSWGSDRNNKIAARNFLSEWSEIIVRDRNHPSIIAWTPFNETGWTYLERDIDNWDRFAKIQHDRLLVDVYDLTRNLDPTRPVNDASGHVHVKTDLWTVHSYQQNPARLRKTLTPDKERGVHRTLPEKDMEYGGQPYFVDEYGGIKWAPGEMTDDLKGSWGYGDNPKTLEEFYDRLKGLTDVILSMGHISGYCYTQLTDIEQEKNGIYYYDRTEKFDMKRISEVFSKSRNFKD